MEAGIMNEVEQTVQHFEAQAQQLATHLKQQHMKVVTGIITAAILSGLIGVAAGMLVGHLIIGAMAGVIGSLLYSGFKLWQAKEKRRKWCIDYAANYGITLPPNTTERQARAAVTEKWRSYP
jgi:hypothetical protein